MAGEDVLTEGEIDALMETVDDTTASDDSDDGEYRRFDFTAREQLMLREFTTLRGLVERQAELLEVALGSSFSLEFGVRAQSPTLLSVADVLASMEQAVAVSNTTLAPLKKPCYAVAPAALMSFVVNAYFGGGNRVIADEQREALTPTEVSLAERLAQLQFSTLAEAWQDKLALEVGELTTLGVPDRLEVLPRSSLLLNLGFELIAGDFSGKLQMLLAFEELEPYRERFAPPKKKQENDAGPSWEPLLRRELPGIDVELAAVLTARPIALSELLQLHEGDVLPLSAPEQVRLQVESMTIAEGRYGSYEGAKAIQLQRLGNLAHE